MTQIQISKQFGIDERKEFVFDYVHLLHYKCHKINWNCGGSYVDSLDQIKKKKKNPINIKRNKCFQYTVTVELNYEEIGTNPEKITKVKPFIHNHNWERRSFPSEKDDYKKFQKNNLAIALNVLYAEE